MTTLKDIRERWEKATPGEWKAERENCHTGGIATCHGDGLPWWEVWSDGWIVRGVDPAANAEAIANAPTDVAYLLDLVERAKVLLKSAESPNHDHLDAKRQLLQDMESAKGGE